jgi:hypothetical protein
MWSKNQRTFYSSFFIVVFINNQTSKRSRLFLLLSKNSIATTCHHILFYLAAGSFLPVLLVFVWFERILKRKRRIHIDCLYNVIISVFVKQTANSSLRMSVYKWEMCVVHKSSYSEKFQFFSCFLHLLWMKIKKSIDKDVFVEKNW